MGTPLVWSPAFRRYGPAKAGTPNGRFMERRLTSSPTSNRHNRTFLISIRPTFPSSAAFKRFCRQVHGQSPTVPRCFRGNGAGPSRPRRPEPPGLRARVPQGRPKIARLFIAGLRAGGPEVPRGRKNARWAEPKAVIPVVPPGLDRSWLPRPSDESLGYSISPFGLTRIPFPRMRRCR